MDTPFTETVTLLRESVTGQDSDGNDVRTGTEIEVPDSIFAPGGTTELIQGEDVVISNPTIYLGMADSDGNAVTPLATDKVRRANGDTYDIDGQPQIYPPNPYTAEQVRPVLRLENVT